MGKTANREFIDQKGNHLECRTEKQRENMNERLRIKRLRRKSDIRSIVVPKKEQKEQEQRETENFPELQKDRNSQMEVVH